MLGFHSVNSVPNVDPRAMRLPWSAEEERLLLAAAERLGSDWHQIADMFPCRTADAVRNHYARLAKQARRFDLEAGRQELYSHLAERACEGRPPCSPRVRTQPRCVESKRDSWTAADDKLIMQCVRRFGQRWRLVASHIPGRSDSSVRNRWKRLRSRQTDVQRLARTLKPSSQPFLTDDGDAPPLPLEDVWPLAIRNAAGGLNQLPFCVVSSPHCNEVQDAFRGTEAPPHSVGKPILCEHAPVVASEILPQLCGDTSLQYACLVVNLHAAYLEVFSTSRVNHLHHAGIEHSSADSSHGSSCELGVEGDGGAWFKPDQRSARGAAAGPLAVDEVSRRRCAHALCWASNAAARATCLCPEA